MFDFGIYIFKMMITPLVVILLMFIAMRRLFEDVPEQITKRTETAYMMLGFAVLLSWLADMYIGIGVSIAYLIWVFAEVIRRKSLGA